MHTLLASSSGVISAYSNEWAAESHSMGMRYAFLCNSGVNWSLKKKNESLSNATSQLQNDAGLFKKAIMDSYLL